MDKQKQRLKKTAAEVFSEEMATKLLSRIIVKAGGLCLAGEGGGPLEVLAQGDAGPKGDKGPKATKAMMAGVLPGLSD